MPIQHTTAAVALAHLATRLPAIPEAVVVLAVREGDDTPLDACSLVAALRLALHALDLACDPDRADGWSAWERLQQAAADLDAHIV